MRDIIPAYPSEIAAVEAAVGVGNKPVLVGLERYWSWKWRKVIATGILAHNNHWTILCAINIKERILQ